MAKYVEILIKVADITPGKIYKVEKGSTGGVITILDDRGDIHSFGEANYKFVPSPLFSEKPEIKGDKKYVKCTSGDMDTTPGKIYEVHLDHMDGGIDIIDDAGDEHTLVSGEYIFVTDPYHFNKSDLKTGMGVEFDNGGEGTVMLGTSKGDIILLQGEEEFNYIDLGHVEDDLSINKGEFKIIRVHECDLLEEDPKILFEYSKPKYTLEQLKEKLGEDFDLQD